MVRAKDTYKWLRWTSDFFPRGLNALFILGMLGWQDVSTESHFLLPSTEEDEFCISWLMLSSRIVLYITEYMVSVVRKISAREHYMFVDTYQDSRTCCFCLTCSFLVFLTFLPWFKDDVDSGQGKTLSQYWPLRFSLLGFRILQQPLDSAPQFLVIWLFNQVYELSQIFKTNFTFSLKSSIILTYCMKISLIDAGGAQTWTLV